MAESTCEIRHGTTLTKLLMKTSLIIWDETPMAHKFCFESLDRSLRDLYTTRFPNSNEKPFGGLIVVCGGDFRQILPVVPKGTKGDIIDASLSSSYLWPYFNVLKLNQNIRLYARDIPESEACKIDSIDKRLLQLGDGSLYDDIQRELIKLPSDIALSQWEDPIQCMIQAVYPSLLDNFGNPTYLKERAILTPKNEMVHDLNNIIMNMLPGEGVNYLNSDNVCKAKCTN
ncbi:uncharacterized protein LOC112519930 [Cynara cardunculus var. scolymus]|uniref:uncharacterized protein LOC112519930 n=1 Tax=Cynara cardunculus var. scolymus TaxID=59895 RepID=UPI000D626DDC|nr:uncharacterized protein LOC112519930 [Cynara cardunculus var. scolymus]